MSGFGDWDDYVDVMEFEAHNIQLGSVNSRSAMNISKEELQENLMRIIYFMKSKGFDKGDLRGLNLTAGFNENSNEKSIRIVAKYGNEKVKSNEEKIWLDRTDIVRKKVNDVFGEDWVVPEIECRTNKSTFVISDIV